MFADKFAELARRYGIPLIADPGYESAEELSAAMSLTEYGRHGDEHYPGGSLSGDGVARVLDNAEPIIFGWLNPHFNDPAAVKISPEGVFWSFADKPENDALIWQPVGDQTPAFVFGMAQILRHEFGDRFPQLVEPPVYVPKAQRPQPIVS